jgi:hypothetical protein
VSVETLRKQARILMWLVTVPLALMSLLALALVGSVVWSGGDYIDVILYWYPPMLLYIWAIWMIRQALKAIGRGEMFSKAIPTLLFRAGLALFVGALFEEVGRNLVAQLVWGRIVDSNTFEASGITLGVVGAMMALIARLFARAVEMRDELDGFV